MIEIISKPKMEKCKNCGCEFTYEKEDTIRHTITNITNPHYGYISVEIKCPQCIDVPVQSVFMPPGIWNLCIIHFAEPFFTQADL